MYFIYGSENDRTNIAADCPLQINSCGSSSSKVGKAAAPYDFMVYRPMGRKDYQLLWVCSGATEFHLDGRWVTVREGQAVLYRPDLLQSYRFSPQMPVLVRWVHFSGTEAEELLSRCGFDGKQIFSPGRCEAAEELFKEIEREMTRKEPLYQMVSCACFRQALALLGRKMQESGNTANEYSRQKILNCVEYINRHFDEIRTVDELADYCCLSKYHFIHTFRKTTGKTPYAFLVEIRMEHARRMLESHSMTVSEVAALCGYSDPLYFSKVFSRYFGENPSSVLRRGLLFAPQVKPKALTQPEPIGKSNETGPESI